MCGLLPRLSQSNFFLVRSRPIPRDITYTYTKSVYYQKRTCSSTRNIPYSWKIWRGIKFDGLAVCFATAKLKSVKISHSHIYVWRSRTKLPNLNPPIVLHWRFCPQYISGYTVHTFMIVVSVFSSLVPTADCGRSLIFHQPGYVDILVCMYLVQFFPQ